MLKLTTITFILLLIWQNYCSAESFWVYILTEVDSEHIIIVKENYEKLLLKKWSLDHAPSLIMGKIFNADITHSEVKIYFDNNPIIWRIEKNLGILRTNEDHPRFKNRYMPKAYPISTLEHLIQSIRENGKIIFLEDDSMWEISDLDSRTARFWLPGSRIKVANESGNYPYILINISDGQQVDAKYLYK